MLTTTTLVLLLLGAETDVDAGTSDLAPTAPAELPVAAPPRFEDTKPAEPPPPDAIDRLAGRWGFGTFGSNEATTPFLIANGFNSATSRVTTPFLGVRYWTPVGGSVVRRLGLELAGGISAGGGTSEQALGGMVVVRDLPTLRTLGVHFAVPLALVSTTHFVGHLAPELRFVALDFQIPAQMQTPLPLTPSAPQRTPGTSTTDVSLRAAGEVFFGFVKIPNLSLELSVRVGLRLTVSRLLDGQGALSQTSTQTFAVPFPSDLLNLFTSTLALKYYL
ncbi:MAG: hypothetical protein GQE15_10985 [Archangiaceae bacterium]|nr:hypothetical protein [Archangiaceae bacterium]